MNNKTENKELAQKVEQWFIERDLQKAEPTKQLLKFTEEVGELAQGVAKGNQGQINDSVGDIAVVTFGLALQLGLDPKKHYKKAFCLSMYQEEVPFILATLPSEAKKLISTNDGEYLQDIFDTLSGLSAVLTHYPLEHNLNLAYDKIKGRKGKMVNGVYIKSQDFDEN